MIDPADMHTKALPQPTRMVFRSQTGTHSVVLDQDLFGDWNVAQSSGHRITMVENFDAGAAMLKTIARKLEKQGFRVIRDFSSD